MKDPYKLLIVDDSRVVRKAISGIFEADDRFQVVGEAADGAEALEFLLQVNPDVVTLDINMPVMDGLTTLKHMMIQNPTPTVMLSTLTQEGASVTFDALKYGAVDFIHKPFNLGDSNLDEQIRNIVDKVTLAAGVEIESVRYIRAIPKDKMLGQSRGIKCNNIIAMGASEGGYSALLKIIPQLPPDLPAACLVMLHVASQHVNAFVNYLDRYSQMKIKRAEDGEPVEGGVCYLGSGEEYVTFHSQNNGFFLQVNPAPFSSYSTRRGSINMLMFSVAEVMKNRSVCIILSGSGDDGVEGMGEILRVGGTVFVQDPKNCMYKEMAQSALNRYKADLVIPDSKIASAIKGLA
jgi:two-component system chemotaxis response regulator CheB